MFYYITAINRKQLEDKFRYMLGLLMVSLVYDLIWFAFQATVSTIADLDRTSPATWGTTAGTRTSSGTSRCSSQ